MSSSKAFLFILLSFLAGVFIASFFNVPKLILWELFILGVFYSLVFFKQRAILVFGLCLIVLGLGVFRAGSQNNNIPVYQNTNMSTLQQKFSRVINSNLSPPQSAILSAILIGDKSQISKQWKEMLNRAGIRHVTAISGMHIVILSSILLWLGINLGLYRGQAFYFAIGFLWLFILMIGFPPSAVRAGVMGSMFLFCEKIGRQKTADRALLLTAAVMLSINPSLLRHSIGFQLSFLAVLGIIYLMPFFQKLLTSPWKESNSFQSFAKPIVGLVAMSLAAQAFVLPLLIYYFGQFSIISPITNILVVPILPALMIFGFLFLIAGIIFQPLALIFLFPVWLITTYITKITEFFAGLSFSAVSFSIHWLWLPIIYTLLGVFVWQIKKRQRFFV